MKLAVVFPGIGYHTDKPLLYYAKKLAQANGYEIKEVPYGNFPGDVKGSPEKMREAFESALAQAEEMLKDTDFAKYDRLLFLSKSIGTAVAAAFAKRHDLTVHQIYYTPVEQTFAFAGRAGIAFHGTQDPWVETQIVTAACQEHGIPLYITEGANHSLETGDTLTDILNLSRIMEQTKDFVESLESTGDDYMRQAEEEPVSYLIRDTTRQQREQIVKESLGYSDVGCEDAFDGYEMYLPYIEGKKELKEITMEYRARYLKNMDQEERGRCSLY